MGTLIYQWEGVLISARCTGCLMRFYTCEGYMPSRVVRDIPVKHQGSSVSRTQSLQSLASAVIPTPLWVGPIPNAREGVFFLVVLSQYGTVC